MVLVFGSRGLVQVRRGNYKPVQNVRDPKVSSFCNLLQVVSVPPQHTTHRPCSVQRGRPLVARQRRHKGLLPHLVSPRAPLAARLCQETHGGGGAQVASGGSPYRRARRPSRIAAAREGGFVCAAPRVRGAVVIHSSMGLLMMYEMLPQGPTRGSRHSSPSGLAIATVQAAIQHPTLCLATWIRAWICQ